MSNDSSSNGGGCLGCISIIVFIFLFWSIFFGLNIGGNNYNLDFFPPQIRVEAIVSEPPVVLAPAAPVNQVTSTVP